MFQDPGAGRPTFLTAAVSVDLVLMGFDAPDFLHVADLVGGSTHGGPAWRAFEAVLDAAESDDASQAAYSRLKQLGSCYFEPTPDESRRGARGVLDALFDDNAHVALVEHVTFDVLREYVDSTSAFSLTQVAISGGSTYAYYLARNVRRLLRKLSL